MQGGGGTYTAVAVTPCVGAVPLYVAVPLLLLEPLYYSSSEVKGPPVLLADSRSGQSVSQSVTYTPSATLHHQHYVMHVLQGVAWH